MKSGLFIDLCKKDFHETYTFQKKMHQQIKEGILPDTLIFVEHNPVYTIGRSGGYDFFKLPKQYFSSKGIKIYEIDRGGSVTFHGPGQLVAYPIIHLDLVNRDLHEFLRSLEEVIIRVASCFHIKARRFPPYTGVWVDDEKIAAIGVGCKKWVSLHGFSINVHTDLNYFSMIEPCGIKEFGVNSLSCLLHQEIPMETVKKLTKEKFEEVFKINLQQVPQDKYWPKQKIYQL